MPTPITSTTYPTIPSQPQAPQAPQARDDRDAQHRTAVADLMRDRVAWHKIRQAAVVAAQDEVRILATGTNAFEPALSVEETILRRHEARITILEADLRAQMAIIHRLTELVTRAGVTDLAATSPTNIPADVAAVAVAAADAAAGPTAVAE